MKSKLLSRRIQWEDVDFVLLFLAITSLFFHYRINGFLVMLLMIYSGIKLVFNRLQFKGYQQLFFLPTIFLVLILGQFWTDDLKEGWTIIERNLSLLLLPIAVYGITTISEKRSQFLIKGFIWTAFGIAVTCLVIAFNWSIAHKTVYVIPNDTHFIYNVFMHHRLTDPLGLHAVYLALFVAFCSLALLYQFLKVKLSRTQKIINLGLILFFCGFLYLLKSANIAVGFTFCTFLLLYSHFKPLWKSSRLIRVIAVVLIITLIGFAALIVQTKLENFSLDYQMSNLQLSPIGIRLSIWECTWEVIKENWLIGTGTGDAHHQLRLAYERNNFLIGLRDDFNAHNMFLQYWLSNGIVAVGLFSAGLFFLIRKAIKHKNMLFLSFVILFILFSLTESTLRTQKGMFFFVLFAGMFYYRPTLWSFSTPEK
jgi:O-antigen ligase